MKIVCFGEILLRLAAPAGTLLTQLPGLEAGVGGAEANVAVSLARFGHRARMAGTLPDNALGRGARDTLRGLGVDTDALAFGPGRMGLYFLSQGAVLRASEVLYDRAGSAFATADPAGYDWPALLADAGWLHLSGVSPALGARPAQAALDAARTARRRGLQVSFDGNYRPTLWAQQGSDGAAVLRELMGSADLALADRRDIALALGRPELAAADGEGAARAAFAAFPGLRRIAATVRTQHGVDRHELAAVLFTRTGRIDAPALQMSGIVDRIGGGDAFAAGLLHGLASGWDDGRALGFGLAAAAVKHSIKGDFNPASEAEVELVRLGALDVRR